MRCFRAGQCSDRVWLARPTGQYRVCRRTTDRHGGRNPSASGPGAPPAGTRFGNTRRADGARPCRLRALHQTRGAASLAGRTPTGRLGTVVHARRIVRCSSQCFAHPNLAGANDRAAATHRSHGSGCLDGHVRRVGCTVALGTARQPVIGYGRDTPARCAGPGRARTLARLTRWLTDRQRTIPDRRLHIGHRAIWRSATRVATTHTSPGRSAH